MDEKKIETFLELEEQYQLNNRQNSGIYYWTYSRFMIWEKLQRLEFGLGKSQRVKRKKLWEKFLTVSMLFYNSFLKPQKLKKDVNIFFLDHPRRVLNDGYYECCYTTLLALEYGNSLTGERPYLARHEKPVREQNLIYLDRISVLGNLNYYFYKLFRRRRYKSIYTRIREELSEALVQINEIWQAGQNEEWITDLIVKRFFVCLKKKEEYRRLLTKIRPHIIVEVVSYSMDGMILNELGKEYGIPTIELQHGTMGRGHAAYNYCAGSRIRQFPDYIFLFSDYWKQITALPVDEDHIRITGYPYFDRQIQKYPRKQQNGKTILFVSQGTIGAVLSRFATELARQPGIEEWTLIYKLHPGEFESWENDYPWLKESGIKVEGKGDRGIYELFSVCDVQIGVYSTALFEGLGFGLRTLIYKAYRSEMFEELCRMGYAEYVSGPEECMEKLKSSSMRERKMFWKQNALENMKTELDALLRMAENRLIY